MTTEPIQSCPGCDETGTTVKPVTLESLLVDEARSRVRETRYRFCETATCETVYFPEDGSSPFGKTDLTVSVGIKETVGPRPVCYCFDHTIEEIRGQVEATGESDVLEDIKTRMADACWCETKSPQGRCCLGLVTRVIRETKAELGKLPSAAKPSDPSPGPSERVLGVAAIAAAAAASACCWLPAGLAILGLSGAAASTVIGELRPILLAATFGLLAGALYLSHRSREVTPEDCCGPEACTTPRSPLDRRAFWILAIVAAGIALAPPYLVPPPPATSTILRAKLSRSWNLGVEGMTCTGCEGHVRSALEEVPGVHQATASYDHSNALVAAEPSVTRDQLEAAIQSIGYRMTDATTEPNPDGDP